MSRTPELLSISPRFPDAFLEVIAEIDDPDIQHVLLEQANPHEGNFHVVGRRAAAIRAVAKIDPCEAFETAWRALRDGKHDRHLYPALLVELEEERAIPLLFEKLLVERSKLVRRGIGLSLRKCQDNSSLIDMATDWVDKGDVNKRRIVAEIAGWMGPPFLEDRLSSIVRKDRLARVRNEASHTLLRYHQQRTMEAILKAMPNETGPALWCSVDSLFALDDAKFVGTRGDKLWIDPVYDHLPSSLRRHLNSRYQDALKAIESELKNATYD